MKKKLLSVLLATTMTLSLAACSSNSSKDSSDKKNSKVEEMSFDDMKKEAKGSTVTFYGWGGDEVLNKWLDDVFAPDMKEKYDIKMERVPMDIDQILSQLSGEMEGNKKDGDIDMIWINGENFKSAKEKNMLYGPFTDKLPNFSKYIDTKSEDVNYDFAYPIKGYEAPYGKAQFVFMKDNAVAKETPKNAEEFLEFCKKYKGKVTYPKLPDFTGSVFVRNIIYETCGGYEQFMDMKADKATVKKAIQPALDYLKKLNPYLWNGGKSFPDSSTKCEKMYSDGELVMYMTYGAYDAAVGIDNGTYPKTTANSANKAGAMVAINEMMSPEIQASRYKEMKTLPVVSYDKLSDDQKKEFDNVDLGKGVIAQDELLSKRLPEMPAQLVPVIEEIWQEEVVGK